MLSQLINRQHLTEIEAETLMNDIMSGKLTENQVSGNLVSLAMKGETIEEITGFARAMREKSTKIPILTKKDEIVFDCCGTGGTGSGVFNISTLVAIIVAAAGIKVAKHGNRGASSKCGSADLLEALDVPFLDNVNSVTQSIESIDIGFLFAPFLHKAMKYAIKPRRELGVRTVFNILGPLTNPASATHQLMGVFDADLTEPIATVLGNLGVKRAMVVHGEGNLDEISTVGKTKISELNDGKVNSYYIAPGDYGIMATDLNTIKGGDIEKNRSIALNILTGKKGSTRDIVVLNAAFSFYICGTVQTIPDGINKAEDLLDSGLAMDKLNEMKVFGAK